MSYKFLTPDTSLYSLEHRSHLQTPIEAQIMAQFGQNILSERQFHQINHELGYNRFRKGTARSLESDTFLYTPLNWIVQTEENVLLSKKCLEFLASIGIVYPGTNFGVYRLDQALENGNQYAIFAITRNLIGCNSRGEVPDNFEKLLNTTGDDWQPQMLAQEGHLTRWMQKIIDLGHDNQGLLKLLDFAAEATHRKNWAWDPSNGKLYPIDMGVININSATQQEAIHTWALSRQYH